MAAPRDWPFVGRDHVLRAVLDRLDGARHVILHGEAGVGKTRLATQVAAELASRGVEVARVVASPGSSQVPLAPFAALAGEHVGVDAVGAIRDALHAHGTPGPGDPVLVVDDLHLLDDASAAVLHQLLVAGGVRLLATLRNAAVRTVGLSPAVDRLCHEQGVHFVEVPPLDAGTIVEMVERALGSPLDGHSRERLVTAATGNPLYARELVEGSLARRVLVNHAGVYTFTGDPSPSPLLEELVLSRLTSLDEARRGALEALTIGGRLPLQLAARVAAPTLLEELERDGLVVATADTERPIEVDVAHPLIRDLLRARLGPLARMRIYRTLADADAADREWARTPSDRLRATVWRVRGGTPPGEDELLGAARQAVAAGDMPLATELAGEAHRSTRSARGALFASWCAGQVGRHGEAEAILTDALASADDPWIRAAIRIRISELRWWTGRIDEGQAMLDWPAEDTGPWCALTEAQRGMHHALEGDLPAAMTVCRPLLDHEHVWVRFVAALAYGLACVYADRPGEAVATSNRFLASLDGSEGDLLGDKNLHLAVQMFAMIHDGQLATVGVLADAAYDSTSRQPSIQSRAWAAMLAGQTAAFAGRLDDTRRFLAEAERLWSSLDIESFAGWCAAGLARAQSEGGLLDDAVETLGRLDGYRAHQLTLNEHLVAVGTAWVAQRQGDRRGAAEALEGAARRTLERGQWVNHAEVWHEAARLQLLDLLPDPVPPSSPSGRLTAARWQFVAACRTMDACALAEVASAFDEMGASLFAAEAHAAAASAHRAARASRDATTHLAHAERLRRAAGNATTPWLAGRRGDGPLSPREREIARLAAEGLSNREIASRLVLSERTVENHLYRIFIKLGITARDALRDHLGPA